MVANQLRLGAKSLIIILIAALAAVMLGILIQTFRYQMYSANELGLWRYDRLNGAIVLCRLGEAGGEKIIARCPD